MNFPAEPRIYLSQLLVLILVAALASPPAYCQSEEEPFLGHNAWTIIPEGKILMEYDSNALQLPGFRDDTIGKFVGGATFTYDFLPGEMGVGSYTQILGQYQAQIWRYAEHSIFNVALNIGTFQISEHFDLLNVKIMDSISPFVGGQVVYKVPTGTGVSRVDFNALAGFIAVKTFGSDKILLGGYQFSNLLADVPQTAYSAHTVYVLYRMTLLPTRINLTSNYQLQLRMPQDAGVPKNLRNTLGLGFQFSPTPGMLINLSGDYTYQFGAPINSRIDFYTFSVSIGSDTLLALP